MNNITLIKICQVIDIYDETDGDRIKVRIKPDDDKYSDDELPYVFPLLPKMLHIKPKVGEWVLVFGSQASHNTRNGIRYYIGPIISQPQKMEEETSVLSALSLFPGRLKDPDVAPSTNAESHGAMADDKDVAIYGRGKSDVILSDKDVKIRCGSRLKDNSQKGGIVYNRTNPSFVQLKHNDSDILSPTSTSSGYKSSAVIGGDRIALVSHQSNLYPTKLNNKDLISNDEMVNLLEYTQSLPYGDMLVEFLKKFIKAFVNHVHPFPGIEPCHTDEVEDVRNYNLDEILSENVRIN